VDTLVKEEFVTAEDFDSSRLSILQECGFNGAVDQAIRTGVLERWCDENVHATLGVPQLSPHLYARGPLPSDDFQIV
jgi:hypothetical protein